jgi:nicotinamide-nucleotide amidase
MQAEIFAIGTELLMGELMDGNSAWLAARLPALGIELRRVSLLGDHLTTLSDAMVQALQGVDLIITTGGLGPTQDDLTREAMAAALHETPAVHAETLQTIERYFQQRGRDMPAPNIKQAHSIPSSQFLPNPYGSAPGWWVEKQGKILVALPGPPAEMHPMWDEQVAPRLSQIATGSITLTRTIKIMGLSEAAVDAKLAASFGQENPYLGIYAKADGIHLRMIARAQDTTTAQTLIRPVEAAIMEQLAPYVWGYDEDTPAQAVGRGLVERGATLATMESGTGGYLVNTLTDMPDTEAYFKGGIVVACPTLDLPHGLPPDVLHQDGTVSQASAIAMAQAVRTQFNATFGLGSPASRGLANSPASR